MLQRLRESLALLLIALLPFHALLVTVLTKWIVGPGHSPLGVLAIWKEGVLGVMLCIAVIELATSYQLRAARKFFKIDVIDALIIGLLILGTAVSLFNTQYSILNTQFIYGIRYDFIPLIAFLILRRVSWSEWFMSLLPNVLYYTGFAVVLYSLCSRFFPIEWFTWLGYSDLHSLYLPDGPLAAFQQIGDSGIRRLQGPMSGPNQLGLWLLIPLSVGLVRLRKAWGKPEQWRFAAYTFAVGLVLLFTFSRAAWIGAAVIIGIVLWPVIKSMSRRAVIGLLCSTLCFLVLVLVLFPSVILRAASSRGHIENPIKAVQMMISHPLGLGLGTAGPASNRTSDACVMLEAGSDASWAKDRPDLCVFVADAQVQPPLPSGELRPTGQPIGRTCHCPFLPENWYLQIGVEMGWIGLGLYLALVIIVLQKLRARRSPSVADEVGSIINYQLSIFLALCIAALFLHAWEDAAVAYTTWILIASTFGNSDRIMPSSD